MFYVLITVLVILLLLSIYVLKCHFQEKELLWDWKSEAVESIYKQKWPEGFLWGSATAAFQVEGNNAPSNWTMWEEAKDENGKPIEIGSYQQTVVPSRHHLCNLG